MPPGNSKVGKLSQGPSWFILLVPQSGSVKFTRQHVWHRPTLHTSTAPFQAQRRWGPHYVQCSKFTFQSHCLQVHLLHQYQLRRCICQVGSDRHRPISPFLEVLFSAFLPVFCPFQFVRLCEIFVSYHAKYRWGRRADKYPIVILL